MGLIAFFDEPEAAQGSLVGGKGANLISLTCAGFPVPPGFIVTAEAYRAFLAGIDWLTGALDTLDFNSPDHLRDQCTAIRARLAQAPLPTPVDQAIRAALARLHASTPTADSSACAVRSSSTFEDLAQAAFAGQHDTYLCIRGDDDILRRIRDCFASLWEDRAVQYRHHHGFSQHAAEMAVVVQRQIDSQVAGVGFSIDPVRGSMNRMVIDANYGLGESVVSGQCEVDHFELDKRSSQILTRIIGHKDEQILATPTGAEHRPVTLDRADQPCLTDDQIAIVAQLLQRAETHYGWPQDIEWGWSRGNLYLFQSRPVTTIQPCWTRDESAERFPNPMTPLSWDFITVAFRGSLKHSMTLMGFPPIKGDWFHTFDHYVYGNQNAVRLLAMSRPVRARSLQELVAELPDLRRRHGWVLDLPIDWARDLDRYLIRLGTLEATPEPATLADAWRLVDEVVATACDYFLPNIAISMSQTILHRLLHGFVTAAVGEKEALAIVDGLLAGCETKTAAVNRELHDLARLVARTPALATELTKRGGQAVISSNLLAAYPDFAARFRRFIDDHGHREMDMDYSVPTWSGQPWVVLDSIALLLRGPAIEDPAETMRAQRLRFTETELRFLSAAPPELRFFFRELIRLARTYTMLDDLEHYQTTRINPLARRAALALGRQLCPLGALDTPEDVFFLNKADAEAIVADPSPAQAQLCRDKSRANKRSYQHALASSPPWSLAESASTTPTPAADNTSSSTLRGVPGSSGRATGPCFLVRGPEDFKHFPSGAILVARTTNPAWTPLFYAAKAVITESGGPLSHGAVTARELGLPAVMSVRGVMSTLKNGQPVTIDGAAGTIHL